MDNLEMYNMSRHDYWDSGDAELDFIESKRDEVATDMILDDDSTSFWETMGFDGFHQAYGHYVGRYESELKAAIAHNQYEKIGKLVSQYVRSCYEDAAETHIGENLEEYGFYERV